MMHQTTESVSGFTGRPTRDTIILKDDIISLQIDLNLLSVEEFIRKYCTLASEDEPRLKITYRGR